VCTCENTTGIGAPTASCIDTWRAVLLGRLRLGIHFLAGSWWPQGRSGAGAWIQLARRGTAPPRQPSHALRGGPQISSSSSFPCMHACARARTRMIVYVCTEQPVLRPCTDQKWALHIWQPVCKLVKQKYGTDFYIIHKWARSRRNCVGLRGPRGLANMASPNTARAAAMLYSKPVGGAEGAHRQQAAHGPWRWVALTHMQARAAQTHRIAVPSRWRWSQIAPPPHQAPQSSAGGWPSQSPGPWTHTGGDASKSSLPCTAARAG